MNVLTSYYIKDNEQEEYRNPWTLYKSWSDFDVRNGGRWKILSYIPILAYVYVIDGVFKKNDTIQFPAPVYTTNTELFSKFDFYYYTKKIEKENLVVFTSITFKDDYVGKLTFYLHSDYKGVNTVDKYILKPISVQFEIPVEANIQVSIKVKPQLFTSADLTLPIQIESKVCGVWAYYDTWEELDYFETTCDLTETKIREVLTTADLTLPIQIESKVCGVWYIYNTWNDISSWRC